MNIQDHGTTYTTERKVLVENSKLQPPTIPTPKVVSKKRPTSKALELTPITP